MPPRDIHGMPLKPGRNVDAIDVPAGLAMLEQFGWDPEDDAHTFMLIRHSLMLHARGEEALAQRNAIAQGTDDPRFREAAIDLTSWYAVLAAARAAGDADLPNQTIADLFGVPVEAVRERRSHGTR